VPTCAGECRFVRVIRVLDAFRPGVVLVLCWLLTPPAHRVKPVMGTMAPDISPGRLADHDVADPVYQLGAELPGLEHGDDRGRSPSPHDVNARFGCGFAARSADMALARLSMARLGIAAQTIEPAMAELAVQPGRLEKGRIFRSRERRFETC